MCVQESGRSESVKSAESAESSMKELRVALEAKEREAKQLYVESLAEKRRLEKV
jgi:hypothetical protein